MAPPDIRISSIHPSDSDLECDWCGKAVRRETAVRRADEGEERKRVVLCWDCESVPD